MMNKEVIQLSPNAVWKNFEMLNEIPRGSKKEERIIAFMKTFGEDLGLETSVDETGNVLIRKPASQGYENRKGIVLQSHLDMVHQKNSDSLFDFDTQGIESLIDGDWVTANGTTLGADNGMGVAAIMSVLEDDSIEHGPLEAFFTIDEETGMTGAFGLKGGLLKGDILLNLDSEDEGELYIGCAGGADTTVTAHYEPTGIPSGHSAFSIEVRGLKGGHSGMDINLGRGNANKILNRLILDIKEVFEIGLNSFDGGSLRNAIPREANAVMLFLTKDENDIKQFINIKEGEYKVQFGDIEPDLSISVKYIDLPDHRVPSPFVDKLILAIDAAPNGVISMNKEIEGLTETSVNMARVLVKDGGVKILFLNRSSVEKSKKELMQSITDTFASFGFDDVKHHGSYPGWEPNSDSAILKTMKEGYNRLYGKVPDVKAIHAGLECGILGTNYPEMDMISFGPTIRNPHSPDEKVYIPSVDLFWDYLLDTLKNVPVK
jgi:dipeptidase D